MSSSLLDSKLLSEKNIWINPNKLVFTRREYFFDKNNILFNYSFNKLNKMYIFVLG